MSLTLVCLYQGLTQTLLRSSSSAINRNAGNRSLAAIPDPYVYRSDGTTTTFYGYGKPIDGLVIDAIVEDLELDLLDKPGEAQMGTGIREYHRGLFGSETSLVLVPTERLTWGMWNSSWWGMERFDNEGWMEFSFRISDDVSAGQEVGWGILEETDPRSNH